MGRFLALDNIDYGTLQSIFTALKFFSGFICCVFGWAFNRLVKSYDKLTCDVETLKIQVACIREHYKLEKSIDEKAYTN